MHRLPIEHPQIYNVIKTNPGSFNAVAADMKLEQTIQWSSKNASGIIEQTRNTSHQQCLSKIEKVKCGQ